MIFLQLVFVLQIEFFRNSLFISLVLSDSGIIECLVNIFHQKCEIHLHRLLEKYTINSRYSSFPIFHIFLPNPGRILPALTYDGHLLCQNFQIIPIKVKQNKKKTNRTAIFRNSNELSNLLLHL